ncbi:MAG: response regulator transcription factor [Erysipelotrichales bacterium]|nr:response regulator transcription factor [Erysipelotrichales bacterium]
MKIVICDDEEIQCTLLKSLIEEYSQIHSISIDILEYNDADNLWWDLQNGLYADLLILDIQMNNMSGIELAHKMRDNNMFHQIAFVSGIKEYVFEGYEVNAISYILKPYEKDQLFKIINKAIKEIKVQNDFTIIESGKEVFKIYHDDLIGIEALSHDTILHLKLSNNTNQKEIILKKGINEVFDELKVSSLLRIHRSFAVNMRNCLRITKTECITEGNHGFPIARGNYDMCMQIFIKVNKGE